jgi:hypothetical protein
LLSKLAAKASFAADQRWRGGNGKLMTFHVLGIP